MATASPVRVYCRLDPLSSLDDDPTRLAIRVMDATHIRLLDKVDLEFTFDGVFDSGTSQEEVFENVAKPLVEGCDFEFSGC